MKDPCPIFRCTSMLYRAGQAFYDRQLKHHGIGSGQQFFLLRVYEEPGISVLELAQRGGYDNAMSASFPTRRIAAYGGSISPIKPCR